LIIIGVAILAIMELGDLLSISQCKFNAYFVAILAIMELGDLHISFYKFFIWDNSRNPRYNGIGWFTNRKESSKREEFSRNPRYNGIGWFTDTTYHLKI